MRRTASNLVQACETSGDAFLQLCRMLSAQGVKLSEASPHLGQLTTELQDLLKLTETKATFSKTLHGLQAATRAGVAGDYFPVGTVISDTWRDAKRGVTYQAPWIVVDYRMVQLTVDKERVLGAILLRKQTSPYALPFFESNEGIFPPKPPKHFSLKKWLNDESGYVAGCSSDLLKVVSEVIVDQAPAVFFLPSLEEVHLSPSFNPELDRLAWEYFRDTPADISDECEKRIFLDLEGKVRSFWLRSLGQDEDCVWCVRMLDGGAEELLSFLKRAFVPACVVT